MFTIRFAVSYCCNCVLHLVSAASVTTSLGLVLGFGGGKVPLPLFEVFLTDCAGEPFFARDIPFLEYV